MSNTSDYQPPKVWKWDVSKSGSSVTSLNRPIAGATHEKDLPVGGHPFQLYSLATPNGQKVTILLEELLALGHSGAEYDAWLIKIGDGDQFGSGFVSINPNSKIPALVDRSGPNVSLRDTNIAAARGNMKQTATDTRTTQHQHLLHQHRLISVLHFPRRDGSVRSIAS
jgi:hypothetical protein